MTTIVQDIQLIRSFRNEIREVDIPTNVINSIQSIHECISNGTDLNGWKKIEWRSTPHTPQSATSSKSNSHIFNNRSMNSDNRTNFNNVRSGGGFNRSRPSNQNVGSSSTTQVSSSNSPTPTSIPLTNSVKTDNFQQNSAPQKYVSRFKKDTEKVDDTILNTIILGKLNKFSHVNYDEVKEFITHIIDSGQSDMIKCFMKLVFQKAASEEMFCPLYAKLLGELSSGYPVLLTEMKNLYSEYMKIFEEVIETNEVDYNELVKRNIEKKYRRGYSQFLAELIKHEVIDTDIFIKTILTIIRQIELNITNSEFIKLNEEYSDCLMKITKAIQSDDLDDDNDKIEEIRTIMKNDCLMKIKPLTIKNIENKGISNKARFTILDIYEGIQAL